MSCRREGVGHASVWLLVCWLTLHQVGAFFPGFRSSPSSSEPSTTTTSSPVPPSTATVQDVSIRIRKTVESDVPAIAEMLASEVVAGRSGGGLNFKNRMDQLFAKADIESLLRGRLFAMREGAIAWERICQVYADETEENRLKVFWATSERFRDLVEKASKDTGEENLWQTHNFVLTPPDRNWFNHLQLTAEDVTTGKVVGFCEVAMLSNPVEDDDDTCSITTAYVESDDTGNDPDCGGKQFSPGITNVATASTYRRLGIATRLLRHTERFVQMYWKAERMGLYVEKANAAAMALYSKQGYTSQVTCDGGETLGEMWYMVKDLQSSRVQQVAEEAEYAMVSGR